VTAAGQITGTANPTAAGAVTAKATQAAVSAPAAAGAVSAATGLAATTALAAAGSVAATSGTQLAFTVGTLAAADHPTAVLTTSATPGGAGGALTASDQRTGGPGG
jgi:hypothetical protein